MHGLDQDLDRKVQLLRMDLDKQETTIVQDVVPAIREVVAEHLPERKEESDSVRWKDMLLQDPEGVEIAVAHCRQGNENGVGKRGNQLQLRMGK